jgi:hypothetical protein
LRGPDQVLKPGGRRTMSWHPASFERDVLWVGLGGEMGGGLLRNGKSHRLMGIVGVAPLAYGHCAWETEAMGTTVKPRKRPTLSPSPPRLKGLILAE